jgi:hypothetical protein
VGGPYPTVAIFVCEVPYELDAGLRTQSRRAPFHGRHPEPRRRGRLAASDPRDQLPPPAPTIGPEGGKDAEPRATPRTDSTPEGTATVPRSEGPLGAERAGPEKTDGAPPYGAASDLWRKQSTVAQPEVVTDWSVPSGTSSPLKRIIAWVRGRL